MPKTLTRWTLKDQAEKALREMIASYRFTPGSWINVDRLAKDLGVSRTPICQALRKLEEIGFVYRTPRKGFRMAQMTLEMARDLYAVRGLLEGMAGRLAAEEMPPKSLARLEALLEKQRPTVQALNVLEYSKLDFDFHAVIYETCGNWLLRELLENIKTRLRPFLCDITPILPELFEDHVEMVKGLKARDSLGVEKALTRHNLRVRHRIERALEERNSTQRLSRPGRRGTCGGRDSAGNKNARASPSTFLTGP